MSNNDIIVDAQFTRELERQNMMVSPKMTVFLVLADLIPFVVIWCYLGLYGHKTCDINIQLWFILYNINKFFVMFLQIYRCYYFIPNYLLNPYRVVRAAGCITSTHNIILIMLGSWFFFSEISNNCKVFSPELFNLGYGIVLYYYIFVLLPFLICCLCVPVVLLLIYFFGDRSRGTSQNIINNIPVTKYVRRTDLMPNENNEVCPICLDEFVQDQDVKIFPCNGQHMYHKTCIDKWLTINTTCPVCRSNITTIVSV